MIKIIAKSKLLLCYTFLILFATTLYANQTKEIMIIETKQIKDILPHAGNETLVIFDIDKTLIQSAQYTGSLACEKHIKTNFLQNGCNETEAINLANVIWTKLQKIIPVKTVETDTLDTLESLSTKNIKIMGLTARSIDTIDITIKQLASMNLSLQSNPIHNQNLSIDNTTTYTENILYVGPWGNKGETLVIFLKTINYKPKRILFIDDSINHCKEVAQSLQKNGFSHICLHYTAAEESYPTFTPAQVHENISKFIGKEKYNKIFKDPSPFA
jgi:phosphoserine phosphatase